MGEADMMDEEMRQLDDVMKDVLADGGTGGSLTDGAAGAPRFRVGSRARVVANTNNHDYRIGATVEIRVFDAADRTYQARELGRRKDGNWIAEADLANATELGWDWLKTALPEEDVLLLRAFDGLEQLMLAPRVRDTLVSRLPGLKSAILRATPLANGGDDAL
jgi:hypothetical protein